jgi:hypothetical protein
MLALSTVADLEEVGITGAAAVSIAGFFSNLDDVENVEVASDPDPEPQPQLQPLAGPESDELEPEPPAELPSGPMAAFDEAAVLVWLGTVPGLTVAQRAAVAAEMAEDEYSGQMLIWTTAKSLRRLLRGTAAEGAVPLLLAARDAHLAAAAAETAAAATVAATAAATAAVEAEQQAAAEAGPLAPPDEFVCAISQQLMVDPVTADEGATAILDCRRLSASRFATQRYRPVQ